MLKIKTVAGLSNLYLLVHPDGTGVPAVEGSGIFAGWYFVDAAALISRSIDANNEILTGSFQQGNYLSPTVNDDDTNGGLIDFFWDGVDITFSQSSGGGSGDNYQISVT